ncbi:MAG: bifunctional diaminohydroxyphosphoribosylaminopyrimidine deaminase/5-amino-6-(5-phosphoribosylamino)uracil reductase RibD [Bacteroides sp.]|nr:bifunctional diaminohydroxyphosphoribosylaminopyrimidine deaminase/5-amino-6-(5-phosphoribosylamino)uracil reductase RibD [Bacteroides sp.]
MADRERMEEMKYMRRALELARLGEIGAHPNPMVGAVITGPDGEILGEGYHQRCGEGHAEVNAVADAERRGADMTTATMYVTLEPCSHYGKTPPCAELIIRKGIRKVVVGCIDPFAKVQGRGIEMLRGAGIEVKMAPEEIAAECRKINRRFFTAHELHRPYVALKWAETADGFVDRLRSPEEPPLKISTPGGQVAVHRYRSTFDAIAVGSGTEMMDSPKLDARKYPGGRAPMRVSFTRREPLIDQLRKLYEQGVTSLLIEGGPTLQRSFIAEGLVDEIRREISPTPLCAPGVKGPLGRAF